MSLEHPSNSNDEGPAGSTRDLRARLERQQSEEEQRARERAAREQSRAHEAGREGTAVIRHTGVRAAAVFVIISAVGVAGVGYLLLSLLDGMMSREPQQFRDVASVARTIVAWRWACPVMAMPALVAGVVVLRLSRSRPWWRWAAVLGASAWLCAMVIALVAVFIACLAPLYTYQPL